MMHKGHTGGVVTQVYMWSEGIEEAIKYFLSIARVILKPASEQDFYFKSSLFHNIVMRYDHV